MAKKKAAPAEPTPDLSGFDYEAQMAKLDAIVRRIESGKAPLGESLALFEQGSELLKQCQQWLDHARLRVTQVAEQNGQLTETDLD